MVMAQREILMAEPRQRGSHQAFERERKFCLIPAEADAFLDRVRGWLEPIVYHNQPLGYVRTTYLDTDDGRLLRSCEQAVSRRLRVREYAAAAHTGEVPRLTGRCCLEYKWSSEQYRRKLRLCAPARRIRTLILASDLGTLLPGAGTETLLRGPRFAVIRHLLADSRLTPRLTTFYGRRCWRAPCGVRITLDHDIAFCPPVEIGCPDPPVWSIAFPMCVLEVKYRGKAAGWLTPALRSLDEARGFSKFVIGMRALEQGRLLARAGEATP